MQGDHGWTVIRSIKRFLKAAGPNTELETGRGSYPLQELVTELLLSLRRHLRKNSTLQLDRSEALEVMIGVPQMPTAISGS